MTMSSRGGDCGLKFSVVADQRPDDVDESAGEGDEGLGMNLALGSFAVVKGFGGSVGADRGERREVDHPAQPAVVPLRAVQVVLRPPGIAGLGDVSKTEQILINLVSNAVNFTEGGGKITIGCGFADSGVWIRVRDTGVGIPAEKQESIFEPFVQVGRSLTTAHRGTGLGLAISREMARGMAGDLTVESKPGEGSSFTVWLPMA